MIMIEHHQVRKIALSKQTKIKNKNKRTVEICTPNRNVPGRLEIVHKVHEILLDGQ